MDKQIKVLLVDDELSFSEPIAFWMRTKGYAVFLAKDGEESIRMIKEAAPDIVFLDINMPGMNGIETLRKIREFNQELPIIMVTVAYGSEENISTAKKLGISGFFAKNYTFDQLLRMIDVALRIHKGLGSALKEGQASDDE